MINLSSIVRLFNHNGHGGIKHRIDYDPEQLQRLAEGRLSTGATPQPLPGPDATKSIDTVALQAQLQNTVEGEVRFDDGSRALYSTDASNYRQIPIGVVIPKTRQDIINTVAACRKFGAPIVSRGGGTSLAGQTCNVAVVMDMSKYYNKILWIDPERRLARIQPGVVLDVLRKEAEKHKLTFGPDPSTHSRCTLGGMMGNNSCGVHSLMAGKTCENIDSMEVLTYEGEIFEVGPTSDEELENIISAGGTRGRIYRQLKEIRDRSAEDIRREYPKIPRRVSGYNLDELLPEKGFNVARALVGTEGTCVTILEATARLVYSPPARTLVVLGYPDIFKAADHILQVLKHKPIGLEAIDDMLVEFMKAKHLHPDNIKLLPDGGGWLLVEFGGKDKQESDARAKGLIDDISKSENAPSSKLYDDKQAEQTIWTVRESGLGATARVPGQSDTWPGWEDSAVAPARLGEYLPELKQLFSKHGYSASVYGHFGQGCVHCRIPFDLVTEQGIENYREFLEEAADLVVRKGGSLSGEHGDGQARAELLPKMFGPKIISEFINFKSAWDPDWKMNPGKKVRPNKIVDNLRFGNNYEPWQPDTHFQFPGDSHSFSRAVTRCVGVGACRRHEGGTMCPSYMATREEKHSTRGRARMLFEMLQGKPLKDGWRSEPVREALDLCLSCKGCKNDCPVNVDMATYKAEFLAHYYENRLRPRNAYAFGLIHIWSRLASCAPYVVNFFTQTPGLSSLAKVLAAMSPERKIPKFAEQSFTDWWKQRPARNIGKPLVVLWPDTFNNYFHPETAQAAVEVLEDAGFQIHVPLQNLCCGRPLYDYGFVPLAKKWLLNILDALRPYIRAGVPLIGLEPSCLSVFRDELRELLPLDEDAQRLHDQSFLLSEFLSKKAPNYWPPKLNVKALLQEHCHHKSILGTADERKILHAMGVDFSIPEDGCCGMAGAFGFEQGDHNRVSQTLAHRNLVPAVSQAPKDTVILANGFSCRQQIEQCTSRRAIHFAELLRLGLKAAESGDGLGDCPENLSKPVDVPDHRRQKIALGVAAAGILAATALLIAGKRNRA